MTAENTRSPGYWQHETSGVLRPAIEALLVSSPMSPEQIATVRAHLRQWITSPVWDANPHLTADDRARLDQLRIRIDALTDQRAIENWLEDAGDDYDPL